jgi:hypothetical protein
MVLLYIKKAFPVEEKAFFIANTSKTMKLLSRILFDYFFLN